MTEFQPEESGTAPGPRGRRVVLLSIVVGVVALGLIAAVAVPGLLPRTHHVQGTVMLISSSPNAVQGQWDACSGQGGYRDFAAGAPTTMRDGNGSIVGVLQTVNLTPEILAKLAEDLRPVGMGETPEKIVSAVEKSNAIVSVACILYFSGEVKDAEFYSFSFSKRGEFTYSRAELDDMGWYIQLSLGR